MADIDVLIFGPPRCGKTTLANMLRERLDCPVIHGDAIANTIKEIFPFQMRLENYFRFWHRYLRNSKMLDNENGPYLLEGDVRGLEDISIFYPQKNIVYFLGVTEPSPDDLFQSIRDHDTEKDHSYHYSDPFLRKYCEKILSASRNLRAECAEYGIPYVETSGDRPAVLAALADEICHRLERGMVGNVRPEMPAPVYE